MPRSSRSARSRRRQIRRRRAACASSALLTKPRCRSRSPRPPAGAANPTEALLQQPRVCGCYKDKERPMKRSREFGATRVDGGTKPSQSDIAFLKERARIRAANDEKTARLRALRLEKEAREREAAAAAEALAPKVTRPRRVRTSKPAPAITAAPAV